MRKDGNAVKPDNQRGHGTGARGGWNWEERINTYRKLVKLCLIIRKVINGLEEEKHH